jgi:hypothetical protein
MNRAPGDAAMQLCRDETRLLTHDRELLFEAGQEVVDVLRRDEKGAHQHDWRGIMFELLDKADAVIQVNHLSWVPSIFCALCPAGEGGCRQYGTERRAKRGGFGEFATCNRHCLLSCSTAPRQSGRLQRKKRMGGDDSGQN